MAMKIETDRLVLRDLIMKDADSIMKYINNLNISKWLLAVPYPYTKKDATWWVNHCLENQRKKERTGYEFGITLKPSSEVIGGVGLSKVDLGQGTAEIGYWLAEDYQRRGIVYEACKSLIDYAFNELKLRKIRIPVFLKNEASNGMAKKLGAKLEGRLRKQCICKATGEIHDDNLYGLLKEEWRVK